MKDCNLTKITLIYDCKLGYVCFCDSIRLLWLIFIAVFSSFSFSSNIKSNSSLNRAQHYLS